MTLKIFLDYAIDLTGHFTQVVWAESLFIGIGCACHDDKFYSVALYYPSGNILSTTETNQLKVEPLKSKNLESARNSFDRKNIDFIDEPISKSEDQPIQSTSFDESEDTLSSGDIDHNKESDSTVSENLVRTFSNTTVKDMTLIEATISGQVSIIKQLYDEQVRIGYQEENQTRQTIQDFMQKWLNEPDEDGMTALHHAIKFSTSEVVKQLLDLEADVYKTDESERNSLHLAVTTNDKAKVELLIDYVAENKGELGLNEYLNSIDEDNFSALTLGVCLMVDIEVLEVILTRQPDTDIKNINGSTCFHIAVETFLRESNEDQNSEHLPLLKNYLSVLSKYCDVNQLDNDGWAPIHMAVHQQNLELLKFLLDTCHCDPNCLKTSGETALILACKLKRQPEFVKEACEVLIKFKADKNITYSKFDLSAESHLMANKYDFKI